MRTADPAEKRYNRFTLWLLAVLLAALFSFQDIAWPADQINCFEYFTIVDIQRDESTLLWVVAIDEWVIDNSTDLTLARFGACVLALIEQSDPSVETLVQFANDGWIPSRWRTVSADEAAILANPDLLDDIWQDVDVEFIRD